MNTQGKSYNQEASTYPRTIEKLPLIIDLEKSDTKNLYNKWFLRRQQQ